MKKLAFAAVLMLAASSATAGSLAEPIMPADIVIQQAATSSVDHAILPPLVFITLVGSMWLLG